MMKKKIKKDVGDEDLMNGGKMIEKNLMKSKEEKEDRERKKVINKKVYEDMRYI